MWIVGVLALGGIALAQEDEEAAAEPAAEEAEDPEAELERRIAEDAGIIGALKDCSGDEDCAAEMGLGASGMSNEWGTGVGGLIGTKPGSELGGLGARPATASSGGGFGSPQSKSQGRLVGEPIVLGNLDPTLVQPVVARHLNQVRYCYQRELAKAPDLGGELVVTFTVAADGSVDSAKVKSSTLDSTPVESCVVNRFVRMRFPAPSDGKLAVVSVAFAFSAASGAAGSEAAGSEAAGE